MVRHAEEDRMVPHNADNIATVYADKRGNLWVTHAELLACDYVELSDFDVVYLNAKFYELQAHIKEPDAWWIEEIETETEEDSEQAPETSKGK